MDDRYMLRDRWYRRMRIDDLCRNIGTNNTEDFCPHASETFNSIHFSTHFATAVRYFQVQSGTFQKRGMTFKRHRCTLCPTEITIDIEPCARFEGVLRTDKKAQTAPTTSFYLTRDTLTSEDAEPLTNLSGGL